MLFVPKLNLLFLKQIYFLFNLKKKNKKISYIFRNEKKTTTNMKISRGKQ